MSLSEHATPAEPADPKPRRSLRGDLQDGPVAIEVTGLRKRFRVPDQRVDSLKERLAHPLRRIERRDLHALRDVSFEVHRGEFFGIVGRNGSGKSTLLKILASIYRADAGRVRMAGRIAPFIELGVGFNPEMSARDNNVLSGVLMGLSRREAARRLDAVLDFAELRDFVDLKIKNYSSGMMVRLAFAIMVQADADVMLIDEVLAVGDAAFSHKCLDVFRERRAAGKTVVLVTHDMSIVQTLCHRAMLLHDGELRLLGSPEDAALQYYRLNFAEHGDPGGIAVGNGQAAVMSVNVRLVGARLVDRAGAEVANLEQGAPLVVDVEFEAARDLSAPSFTLQVVNDDGVTVFAFTRDLDEPVAAGRRITLRGEIENRLTPGGYHLDGWIRQDERENLLGMQPLRLLRFAVYGTATGSGVVSLDADVEARVR